ncbi:MAG TPA: hypothetical protein VJV79_36360 [Polyangiaceae bacterium]|nr:hypothetical protein [Polyangiaceae bacterium]
METNETTGGALEKVVVRSEAFLRRAPTPAILGAVAGLLALAFVVRRANQRRRRLSGERGDSVLGVMARSALSAAIATIPKTYLLRLARSALKHEPAPPLAEDSRVPSANEEPQRV